MQTDFAAALEIFQREQIHESAETTQNLRTYCNHLLRLCPNGWSDLHDPQAVHARFARERDLGATPGEKLGRRPRSEKNLELRSPSSRNQMLWTLRLLVPWAVGRDDLPSSALQVLQRIKRSKRQPKPAMRLPTREVMQEFLRRIDDEDPRLGSAARFLALTGLRRGAALRVRWKDIDWERGVIWAVATKGKEIVVPMLSECRELLEKVREANLYAYRKGDLRVFPLGSTMQNRLEASMKRHSEELGITIGHFHACRHYFNSACLEMGVPVHELASIIGHSDGGRTLLQVYAHVNAANIARRFSNVRLIG